MDVLIFPGKGKDWLDGIGQEVLKAGYQAAGLDLEADFLNLTFSEQVAQSKQFIESEWDRCSLLIGKSYGAYLILHALADLPPYPGAVLLFSPVIGMTVMKSEKGNSGDSIPISLPGSKIEQTPIENMSISSGIYAILTFLGRRFNYG